jgi:hypothetical protein
MIEQTVRCKNCKQPFIMKDENEYILSYCEKCNLLIVIYKVNPAVLARDGDKEPVFISSGPGFKCRKCGSVMTVKNGKDYYSLRCVQCAFSIIYRMPTHRGVARFISGSDFDKDKYWLTGKRALDRAKRDEESKK